jgi:hypothetical protein
MDGAADEGLALCGKTRGSGAWFLTGAQNVETLFNQQVDNSVFAINIKPHG